MADYISDGALGLARGRDERLRPVERRGDVRAIGAADDELLGPAAYDASPRGAQRSAHARELVGDHDGAA